jgi:hypothetical protein
MKQAARGGAEYVRWNEMKGCDQKRAEPAEILGEVEGKPWVDKRSLRGAY